MPPPKRPPAYRKRKVRGKQIAYLTLSDAAIGARRDYWLGPYGSPESRERYARLVAEWEAAGRRVPGVVKLSKYDGPTISQICHAYLEANPQNELILTAVRIARQHFGSTPATKFSSRRLRMVREAVMAEKLRCRTTVNKIINYLKAIFRWAAAASQEFIDVSVYRALTTVPNLRRGEGNCKEPRKIGPVPEAHIEAIKPYVSRQIWALVQLQMLTGARSGELLRLRPCDLDVSGQVWLVKLDEHKTAHHGKERVLYLGPRAQTIIKPFLAGRPTTAYLFSPVEAEAERRVLRHAARKTPLSCGNKPGTNRVVAPRKQAGEKYTADSYRRAVLRACKAAGIPNWHPHQLRHTYATIIRRQYDLEAAQVLRGHSSAVVTDAVYAERDQRLAMKIAGEMG